MAIVINGSGTVTGISVGGLPDGIVDDGTLATDAVTAVKIADNAVDLAEMASGTDGQIITYDASGNPTAVGPGTDGQVLTSTGAGSPPAFETAAGGGITEADQWRLTANITSNTDITTNLERNDSTYFGLLGTGMSHSSGVFTFPSTGHWLVSVRANFVIASGDNVYLQIISTRNNGGSWQTFRGVGCSNKGSSATGNTYTESPFLFDISDTANHKVKFNITSLDSGSHLDGDTTDSETAFTFIRLGGT
jgi:hypothetical protein